jgi:hypothetical protein
MKTMNTDFSTSFKLGFNAGAIHALKSSGGRSDTTSLRTEDKSLRKDSNQSSRIGGLESCMERMS